MTLQKHLRASDHYSGLYFMRSDDLGATWTKPELPPELDWRKESDTVDIAVADVTPGWHAPTGKVLAIGAEVRYSKKGEQLDDQPRSHQTAYAVYDPKTGKWAGWKRLEMPTDDKWNFARSACAQWLVAGRRHACCCRSTSAATRPARLASVTVVQCSFDGREVKYLRHGTELTLDVDRGLVEPSLDRLPGQVLPDDPQRPQGLRHGQRRRPELPADQALDVRRRQGAGQLQHAAALAGPQRRAVPGLHPPRGEQRPHLPPPRPALPRPGGPGQAARPAGDREGADARSAGRRWATSGRRRSRRTSRG